MQRCAIFVALPLVFMGCVANFLVSLIRKKSELESDLENYQANPMILVFGLGLILLPFSFVIACICVPFLWPYLLVKIYLFILN